MRRRIRKEFTWRNSAWVLTNEVRYLYDGNLVLQDRNEFNVATKTFTRGLDLSGSLQAAGGIGGLLCFSDHTSGPTYHIDFHADGNGNVTALVDRNQQVVARYLYDPFGKTLASSGPIADLNLYCFSSTELHVQSGLLYYLYRYYDLNLQRWVNRDPIEENGGINLFACAANSPINWVDLFGAQSSISTPAGAAAAAEAEAISLGFPSAAAMRLATKIADIVAKYAAAAIATAGTTSFCKGPKDPCKGLRNQLNLHIGKLLQYINDPLSMDHLGLLRNAAPDVQDRLIKGRIDSLLKQIKNFRTQLEACEKLNGLQ